MGRVVASPLGNFLIFQDMFKCNIPLDSAFNSVQNGVLFGKICGRVPVKKKFYYMRCIEKCDFFKFFGNNKRIQHTIQVV